MIHPHLADPAATGLPGRTRTAGATLVHVLGDLVHPSGDPVPTAAFLGAMATMGHEGAATRQVLLRMRKSGWLLPERRGRETWWSLTPTATEVIADGQRRIASLGGAEEDWDGHWVLVVMTIPHERRAVRDQVYRYLSWSGFGMPVPGLWVSPHVRNEAGAEFAIHHFGLEHASASFTGTAGAVGMTESEMVAAAWDIGGLEAHYDELVSTHGAVQTVSGEEAMRALLALDADLRPLPLMDPQLPAQFTAGGSHRRQAQTLLDLRARWLEQARPHWDVLRQLDRDDEGARA